MWTIVSVALTGMLPVERHEGGGRGNVVAVRLVRADADVAHAHLRLGHDGCRIFVLGRLETPRHGGWVVVLGGCCCGWRWWSDAGDWIAGPLRFGFSSVPPV